MSQPDISHDPIEELAESFVASYRRGERPNVEEYARKYPGLTKELRELLPTLILLEQQTSLDDPQAFAQGKQAEPVPREIGDFEIVREIGRGGMGTVFEARQKSLSRRVALKVLPLAATLDPRALQRFRNETMAVAQLDHPNIVDVFGVGSERGVHFYAMRYIEGTTLAEIIARLEELTDTRKSTFTNSISDLAAQLRTPETGSDPSIAAGVANDLHEAETLKSERGRAVTRRSVHRPAFFRSIAEMGIQVAEALDHAHQSGIIHRDIKPSNLMVDARGKVWITDFGLARIEAAAGMTMTGDIVGTLRYMSPEQAMAKRVPVDHRTDIYSLGVTLYELLTLRPAFPAEDRRELLRQIAFEEPTPPHRLDDAIPPELETVVCKAMAKSASERYANAQEFADDLRRFVQDKPILARRPSPLARLGKWSRRHKPLVAAAAALIVLAAIGSSITAVLLAQERDKTAAALETSEAQKKQLQIAAEQLEREQRRAEENFQKTREVVDRMFTRVAEELKDQPHMEQIRRRLLEDALEFYQGFLKQKNDDVDVRHETALVYTRVGNIYSELGRYDEAVKSYEQALTLLDPLVQKNPDDPTYQVAMANAHAGIAYSVLWLGRPGTTFVPRQKVLAIYEDLSRQFPQNAEYLQSLAVAHSRIGNSLYETGRHDEAIVEFGTALSLYDKCQVDFPTVPLDKELIAATHHWRGAAFQKSGRPKEAEQDFRQCLEMRKELSVERPQNASQQLSLTHIQAYLGDLLFKAGQRAEAIELFQQACQTDEDLLADYPSNADIRRRTANDYSQLGNLLRQMDRILEAEAAMRRGMAVFEKLASDSGNLTTHRFGIAWNNYELGLLLEADGRTVESAELFRAAIDDFKKLETESPKYARFVSNLGFILATCPASQFRDPECAAELANQALQLEPNGADHWGVRGIALYRAGDFAGAIESLEKAIHLPNGDQIDNWHFLAMAHWQQGDPQQAKEWYDKATSWLERHSPVEEQVERFRDEATKLLQIKTDSKE